MEGDLRVAVVDDHATFSDLLARALDAEPGMTCVGTAADAAGALALVATEKPDAVVMDVQLLEDDGLETTAKVLQVLPGTRVVVLTARTDANLVQRAAEAGACSLMPKNGSLADVLHSLRTAPYGGLTVHPQLLRELVGSSRDQPVTPLTEREREVLRLLQRGLQVRQIAHDLSISDHTARGHVKRLLQKLGAHSQLEAVAVATRIGLLP